MASPGCCRSRRHDTYSRRPVLPLQANAAFAAFYVFIHNDLVASVIIPVPDYASCASHPTLAYGSRWSLPPLARYWQHRRVLRPRRVFESGKLGLTPLLHRLRQRPRHRLPTRQLPRPRHRLLLCVLGSGKNGVCIHPRRAHGSGKTMAAPRPLRLGLLRLRYRHPRRLP